METFLFYIAKSVVSLALLYSVYWLFLKKDTFFFMNRFYLMGSIVLSIILPFFNFSLGTVSPDIKYVELLQTITITEKGFSNAVNSNLNIVQIVMIAYITGVVLFSLRFLFQIVQISRLLKRFSITRKEGLYIVSTDANYAPFSFFNLIFLNDKMNKDDAEKIIAHELIHVKQHHSFDIVVLELLTIFQWFNPFVWFIRYSLKEIHEYLADEGVLLKGYEKVQYQQLLLTMSIGAQVNDLSNNFNKSLIKRRFIMMTKMKSSLPARLKIMLVIPFIASFILVFACSNKENPVPLVQDNVTNPESQINSDVPPPPPPPPVPGSVEEQNAKNSNGESGKKVYKTVETLPEFKGGQNAMINYLVSNIKYPENAKKKGIQGKVFVAFIVGETGKVSNVRVVKGVNAELDAEAVRVVASMPDWNPGKDKGKAVDVELTLPIQFKLN